VAPLVAKWSGDYQQRADVTVTYGAIGSGGGIAQITARTVDFGASDAPLTPDQADNCRGCVQVPWALAATVLAYNVKGAPRRLRLSGPVLADIFLGKVTQWNDSAIARLNPGVQLSATRIAPVFRSDGSGDTYALSDFLAKVSPEWKSKEGVSTQVSFPAGVGAKGNDGVAAVIGRTDGAIGYLAISYVVSSKLDYALVRNAAGTFPVPGTPSILAAAKTVTTIPADNAISITDPPASAPGAYPISTFTYAIVPKSSGKASTLRPFLTYAITAGQKFAPPLTFAPLPPAVVAAGRSTISAIR
jgi:phosphate transport system substrate-binding protein